jgi:DMSO reductase anchor subunit/NAD-dependent dihydropyrimidine dehydrogenase PreA subunit
LAYSRKSNLGLVLHQPQHCIGCKFCTWVCPYDAPKFNPKTSIVEKCDFCEDLLQQGQAPSCVAHCPTAALAYQEEPLTEQGIPFNTHNTKPSLTITGASKPPLKIVSMDAENTIPSKSKIQTNEPSLDLWREWPLMVFTLLISWFAGRLAFLALEPPLETPFMTLALGWLALALSGFHLGKKMRAARAILNLRNSALSREILICTLAVGAGTLGLLFFANQKWLPYCLIPLLLASVASIDLVYRSKPLQIAGGLHSAETTLTAALVLAISFQQPVWINGILGIKLLLVAWRYLNQQKFGISLNTLPWIRIWSLGLAVLMVLYAQYDYRTWLTILIGELVDRILFYKELKIPHAQNTLQ